MSQMPDELKRRIPHNPKLWVRNMLNHPNSPERRYDFYTDGGPENGEFLWYLVDEEGPMEPENWGDINVFLFGRGNLKTWTCTSIAAWAIDTFPAIEGLATAPVDDQRYEVIERFKDKVEQSGLIAQREKDKLSHQKFRHTVTRNDGSSTVSYSALKSRSAWGDGDKLRGLHTHFGIFDESQDLDEGTFSTALEAVDREVPQVSYFPTTFIIGTPKMANTFFHKLWKMSDQMTWDSEQGEWIQQAEGEEFLPEELKSEKQELTEQIERLEAELSQEPDGEKQELVESLRQKRDDITGFTVKGWHIDQPNSPLHKSDNIAYKKQVYSKRKFENEVLANFYSPENDLITNDDVWAAINSGEDMTFVPTRRWEDSTVYLTVDWGGGKGEGAARTVVAVGEQPANSHDIIANKISVLSPELSHAEEREKIHEYMQRYEVDLGVVDEGFGDTDREELQDEYGYDSRSRQPIYGCYFGNVKNAEEIKWNRHEDEKRFFTVSKTYTVKKFAEDFKNGDIIIPKESLAFDTKDALGTQLLDQLTAPYTERKENPGGKKKILVKSDRNDDIFDGLNYLWIASRMVKGNERGLRKAASVSRPGY